MLPTSPSVSVETVSAPIRRTLSSHQDDPRAPASIFNEIGKAQTSIDKVENLIDKYRKAQQKTWLFGVLTTITKVGLLTAGVSLITKTVNYFTKATPSLPYVKIGLVAFGTALISGIALERIFSLNGKLEQQSKDLNQLLNSSVSSEPIPMLNDLTVLKFGSRTYNLAEKLIKQHQEPVVLPSEEIFNKDVASLAIGASLVQMHKWVVQKKTVEASAVAKELGSLLKQSSLSADVQAKIERIAKAVIIDANESSKIVHGKLEEINPNPATRVLGLLDELANRL